MSKISPKKNSSTQTAQRLAQMEEQLKRTLADYSNLEKRIERERQFYIILNTVSLVSKFLEVLDDFYLANRHLNDPGLKMAIDKFNNTLKNLGVVESEARPGQEFNPETMECISTAGGPDNQIIEVHKTGYSYEGQLIRPAQVTVGKTSSNTQPDQNHS